MDENTTPPPTDVPPTTADPVATPISTPAAYPRGDMTTVSQDEKSQAMLMWILAIFFGFIPPLIFFFVAKDKPFVYRHSAQALALTILVAVIDIILFVTLVGALLIPLVWIVSVIFCIMGAMAANNSKSYDVPGSSALAKALFKV